MYDVHFLCCGSNHTEAIHYKIMQYVWFKLTSPTKAIPCPTCTCVKWHVRMIPFLVLILVADSAHKEWRFHCYLVIGTMQTRISVASKLMCHVNKESGLHELSYNSKCPMSQRVARSLTWLRMNSLHYYSKCVLV